MGGVFERTEKEIGQDLLALEPLLDDRTVLATHGPAAGALDSTQFGPAGSTSLRDLLARQIRRRWLGRKLAVASCRQTRRATGKTFSTG
jgi:hypothetical protein